MFRQAHVYKEKGTHIGHVSYSDIKDYKIDPAQKLSSLPASKISVISNVPQKLLACFHNI